MTEMKRRDSTGKRILDVLLKLARTYQRRDNLQAAYFAYFVCRYEKKNPVPPEKNGELQEFMVECMKKKSFYCQLNALQALYAFGDVEYVMEAVRIQDTVQTFYNEKILTEGLLSFSGDHNELIHRLRENSDHYSEKDKIVCARLYTFSDRRLLQRDVWNHDIRIRR